MVRIRRWRVARVNAKRKGGFDAPPVRYWTYRGARAAAIQLNMLHEKFQQRSGILSAFEGSPGENRWMPVRHRTLRSVMAHNIVVESGSLDRHPAGSLSVRLNRRTAAPVPTAPSPTNLCSITGECAGPWTMSGHCVHCGKLTVDGVVREEKTSESTAPEDADPGSAPVGDREDTPEWPNVPQRDEVCDEAKREPSGGGDQRADPVVRTDRAQDDRS